MNRDEPLLMVGVSSSPGYNGPAAPEELLRGVLDLCYRTRRKKPASMDLLVADDATITRLNRRHLGHAGPTDVLAFADGETEDGRLRLGDVAVGGQVAERESASRSIPFEHELAFYALHGLLHLLGMDDANDKDRAEMHRLQLDAMRTYGLPIPPGFSEAVD